MNKHLILIVIILIFNSSILCSKVIDIASRSKRSEKFSKLLYEELKDSKYYDIIGDYYTIEEYEKVMSMKLNNYIIYIDIEQEENTGLNFGVIEIYKVLKINGHFELTERSTQIFCYDENSIVISVNYIKKSIIKSIEEGYTDY